MNYKRTVLVWFLLLISVLTTPQAIAKTVAQNSPSPLVSAEWLKANIQRDDIVVIDASSPRLYQQKHIPGAISANVFMLGSREVTPAAMERLVRSWGVNPGKKIVLYDEGATFMATSLFFELYHHGFSAQDMFILDGGLAKWEATGGAVAKDVTPAPAIGNITHPGMREAARARQAEFVSASGTPEKSVLVEPKKSSCP
jgi:thiosulfate/3-mercaptopyruvate sulfurtransferase